MIFSSSTACECLRHLFIQRRWNHTYKLLHYKIPQTDIPPLQCSVHTISICYFSLFRIPTWNNLDARCVIWDDNCWRGHLKLNHAALVSFRINWKGKKEREEKRYDKIRPKFLLLWSFIWLLSAACFCPWEVIQNPKTALAQSGRQAFSIFVNVILASLAFLISAITICTVSAGGKLVNCGDA